jgi:hypothetical protein
MHSGETFEFDNLAADPTHSATVDALHKLLVSALTTALVPPVSTATLLERTSVQVVQGVVPPPPSPVLDCGALLASNMDLYCPV